VGIKKKRKGGGKIIGWVSFVLSSGKIENIELSEEKGKGKVSQGLRTARFRGAINHSPCKLERGQSKKKSWHGKDNTSSAGWEVKLQSKR